jgi:hypothetical protein
MIKMRSLLFVFLFLSLQAAAEINTLDAKTLADSNDVDLSQMLFGYDMAVDASNNVHIVYSRPANGGKDEIIYVRRINGVWFPEVILSNQGTRDFLSIHIQPSRTDGGVYVCYVIMPSSTPSLVTRKISSAGVVDAEKFVSLGSWHTVMQVDANNRPIFIREGENSGVSKLILYSTSDNNSWSPRNLILPATSQFRLADFLYTGSVFHLTYGDYCCQQSVLNGKGSTQYVTGHFHNLRYAKSNDSFSWSSEQLDSTGTLYEMEFWSSLLVINNNPIIGFYKYNEYNSTYNTGTSAKIMSNDGVSWNSSYTDTRYPDSREGPALSLAKGLNNRLLGIWDYSPDDTHNAYFRGAHGNIAISRINATNQWYERLQLAPFSAEGRLITQSTNNRLHILVMGDFVDKKIYYREVDLSYLDQQFEKTYSGFPWNSFFPAIIQ